jgi:DNA-binding response OmpR family regulator
MSPKRIAIVEDEYLIAVCFEDILGTAGYDVVGIFSSAETLFESLAAAPVDLILMDVHLAGKMNGVEATRTITERWKIPVIVLTGYGDAKTKTMALDSGATNVLNKPVPNPLLMRAVHSVLKAPGEISAPQ